MGQGEPRKSSPLRAVSAVLGAFIGIRKSSDRDGDIAGLKPAYVIVAAVIAAAIFVLTLITLVQLIT